MKINFSKKKKGCTKKSLDKVNKMLSNNILLAIAIVIEFTIIAFISGNISLSVFSLTLAVLCSLGNL